MVGESEAIKGIWGTRVGAFIRVDEEGFFAVGLFDVVVGDTGLEVEDVVGVGAEGREDAGDFGVLSRPMRVSHHCLAGGRAQGIWGS